ncbi:hypothetical protein DAPPUDRAFT_333033 [Daphnia pulex]|uniref:SWIM-type domain-containing protein n=1 Tax=Daphnia pulex TaxID=6669 RepID=E9HRM8_DAPPU|nr:hypothetical protein DAPPUDRAFT_333033 [Daphnia pulex]|eukprot:EFX65606.1 hypothetical protein DAPPUDRAFT_333033 [Daphnia pulex]
MGDNTTNKIERYHRTIKDILLKKGRRFSTVVKTLLDIVTQRLLTKQNKELEVEIRFPTLKIAPDQEDLRKGTNEHTVTSKSGIFTVSLDYMKCSCWFSKRSKLSCSHTIFAHQKCGGPWPSYARWNANSVAANDIHLLPNNLPSVTTVVGPGPKRRNAKQAITELNMVLQTISTTVQGFPVHVLCG